MASTTPRFSAESVSFLKKAGRAKRADWLDRNRDEFERVLLAPYVHLAGRLKSGLAASAPDYHFPQKGIGRLKRAAHRVERGGGLFKSWISYSASRPKQSRFESNPNLYFMIDSDDADDTVLVAGGLYVPSSPQVRAIRNAIAQDASAFEKLFRSKEFASCFPGGFSPERISSRVPRGFDANHEKIEWLKLQAFFVWRSYSKKEFHSSGFADLVIRDWKQILRLNRLLEAVLARKTTSLPARVSKPSKTASGPVLSKIDEIDTVVRPMDF